MTEREETRGSERINRCLIRLPSLLIYNEVDTASTRFQTELLNAEAAESRQHQATSVQAKQHTSSKQYSILSCPSVVSC